MLGQGKPIIVVYLDRNRLQFYGGSLPSILSLDIPPAIIKDLEVINRDGLYTLVNQWLKQNALGGVRLFLVLGPGTYFEKAISAASDSQQETEILQFYDRVPFDELTTKIIPLEGGKRAFAVNKAYLEAIRHAFLLQGLSVAAAIPAFLLGTIASKRWLDAQMGVYVVKHIDTLKEFNVLESTDESISTGKGPSTGPTSQNNPRLMIMVGIFGLLLLFLIFFIFTRH